MKPIEPGCLAVVISGDKYRGQTCTCVQPVPKGTYVRAPGIAPFPVSQDAWLVDFPSKKSVGLAAFRLMRIDGHDETEDQKQDLEAPA